MNTYTLKIASPNGEVFCDEVVSFSARGVEGELAILAGHVPFVTPIKACECKVGLPDGTVRTAHTDGGVLTVSNEKTIFLSGTFAWNL